MVNNNYHPDQDFVIFISSFYFKIWCQGHSMNDEENSLRISLTQRAESWAYAFVLHILHLITRSRVNGGFGDIIILLVRKHLSGVAEKELAVKDIWPARSMDSKTHVKSKRTTSIVQGATITLHNVSYHVPTKKPGSRWATYDKVILRNIKWVCFVICCLIMMPAEDWTLLKQGWINDLGISRQSCNNRFSSWQSYHMHSIYLSLALCEAAWRFWWIAIYYWYTDTWLWTCSNPEEQMNMGLKAL